MRIHVLGTVNGIENEGMRNVATQVAREFEKDHEVCYSGLRQIHTIIRNARKCDVTLVFARANKLVYYLGRVLEVLCKRIWIVCVQKPNHSFIELNNRRPLSCGYLAISAHDLTDIKCVNGKKKYLFPVGINAEKFFPVSAAKARDLKMKYGFSVDKPLLLHVGHCSVGRGLDDLLAIDGSKMERLVVASGMFEDTSTVERLTSNGVHVHNGFLRNVEEVFQMADVYLFPTRSAEFVISIPLSVMEALSCGTPVVAYKSFENLNNIPCVPGALTQIDSVEQLEAILPEIIKQKQNASMLMQATPWSVTAQTILDSIKEEIQ